MIPLNYSPEHCRPEAFRYFFQHFEHIASTRALVHCAVAVSMHAIEDLHPQGIDAELDKLADLVRKQCPSPCPMAVIAHLHEILFEQEHFCGCGEEHYYHPRSSYLSLVLKTKRGLPILLSLVYKAVAERLGLHVDGICSRGHFLLRVDDGEGWLVVDPFQGGRVLCLEEAVKIIGDLMNETLEPDLKHLPTATHEEWITRIIVNLAYAFDRLGCEYDSLAMNELLAFSHAC